MSLREALSGVQAHNPERKIQHAQSESSESSISSIKRTTSQLSVEVLKYRTRSKERCMKGVHVVLFGKVVKYVNNFEVIITQLQLQKQKGKNKLMTFAVEMGVFINLVPLALNAFMPQHVPSKKSIILHTYGYSKNNNKDTAICPLILILHVLSILTDQWKCYVSERLFYPDMERSGS